jgi:hypothetical protein
MKERWRNAAELLPWTVAALGAFPTLQGLYRLTFASLGRDQGIFQYAAWAVREGEVAYRDFREINGPLIQLIHGLFHYLGADDEHRFRQLDSALCLLVFGIVGWALAKAHNATRLARYGWTCAAATTFGAGYLTFDWWDTAQREGYYDHLILLSIALQVYALAGSHDARRSKVLMVGAGLASALTWFGKPTCGLYALLQLLSLALQERTRARAQRALHFGFGCMLASIFVLAYVLKFGDAARAIETILLEVPRFYRFIWKRSWQACYRMGANGARLNYAVISLVAFIGLLRARIVPRHFLPAVALVIGGAISFFAQGKGFAYHLHPVVAGTRLLWLAIAIGIGERARRHMNGRWLAATVLAGAGLAIRSVDDAVHSEAFGSNWSSLGYTATDRTTHAYLRQFERIDFFPEDLRAAAAYLEANTTPTARIQTYGMDPYLLFLAKRHTATPFIYSFELDAEAAINGGDGGTPTATEASWLKGVQARHEQAMLERLRARPPAAFVFFDRAPFRMPTESVMQFAELCSETHAWMQTRYVKAKRFGTIQVWVLRSP